VSPASIAVVTSNDPRYVDPELPVIAEALGAVGVSVDVVSWDDEVDWAAYALVVVRSPWDYFDRVVEFFEWAAAVELVTRIVNPVDVLRWNSHKGYLVELAAKGVPTVPTRLIPGESVDVDAQLAECPWEDVIVQPFVPGIVDGERSLVFFGGALSHAVLKVPASGDYRVQHFHGGSELEHAPDSAELRVALAAIDNAPGRLTYARVDLVDWEGAPSLIELEAVEPDLYLRDSPERLDRFVAAVCAELRSTAGEGPPS